MDKQGKIQISKELEQFHCSILLDEVKEKVRKLKAYGVDEAEIVAAMNEEELFPQLVVTEDYKVVLADGVDTEVKMEPLVKAVYLLFLAHPEIKRQLWGGHLWNPSYFVATVSDRSLDQVKTYINEQKKQ